MTTRTGAKRSSFWAPESRWCVVLSCALLVALAFLTLRNWLGGGLPTSPRQETIPELTITWMFRQELLSGQLLSEWNPTWFSGFPWLRFLSFPLYYGLAALSAWGKLALETVMVLYYLVVAALSGLMMFAYLRHVWRDWRPALVAAVIYQTWPYHHYAGVETWIHAAIWVWVPLVLWLIERTFIEGRARDRWERINALLLLGIALGLLPVISSEYTLIAGPSLVLYWLARTVIDSVQRRRAVGGRKVFLCALGGWFFVGLVALGVAAFFILPGALEVQYVGIHSKHGTGSTFTAELLKDYGTTPGLLWYGIAKRFGLSASTEGLPGIARSFWGATWYPGLVTLGLVTVGLAAIVQDVRRRGTDSFKPRFVAWAALGGLVLALMFSMGPNLPLNPFTWLPVLRNLSPFRGLLLAGVWLAVLAGGGVRWILGLESLRNRVFIKNSVSSLFIVGVSILVILDHWPSAAAYRTTDAYFTADEMAAYAWLREQANQDGRLWDVTSQLQRSYVLTYSLSEVARSRYSGYYDNGAPLYTRHQLAATDLVTSLRLHQTRYVLVREDDSTTAEIAERLLVEGYRVAYENDSVRVLEDPNVGGYARFYRQVALDVNTEVGVSLGDLPTFLANNVALVAQDSLPGGSENEADAIRYAYVYADPTENAQNIAQLLATLASSKLITSATLESVAEAPSSIVTTHVERPDYDTIRLSVSVSTSGLLTIAESWYPHWHVWVNGVEQPVVRANEALLGVWLEPGEQRVEFRFERPWYIYLAYGLTIVTWLAIILWWTWYLGQVLKSPEPLRVDEDDTAAFTIQGTR